MNEQQKSQIIPPQWKMFFKSNLCLFGNLLMYGMKDFFEEDHCLIITSTENK